MKRRLCITAAVCAALLAMLLAAGPAMAQLSSYGYGNARQGSSPTSVGIDPAQAHNLLIAWRAKVGGAVNGQPVSVDGVRVRGRDRDLLIIGTETGQVVALDEAHGQVLWRRQVGRQRITPECDAAPNSVFGVTGTLSVNLRAGLVYAVDVTGRAWAFRLATGAVARGWPVRVHPRGNGFVWGALTLSRGWLYVPVASLCDFGHVFGGITAVNVAHPTRLRRWLTTGGTGSWGGGIWGWGGVSVDDRTGEVYAATGNAQGLGTEQVGYAEAVIALSPALHVDQFNQPLAPGSTGDLDFGTTPVLFQAPGCPAQLVAINKDGELFLYDRGHLDAGPVQRIRVADDQPGAVPLYGMPAYDPATRTLVLTSPSTPPHSVFRAGLQAFRLTAGCRLAVRWQQAFDPGRAGSPPTIADGVVYISGGRDGWFRAYRLSDGVEIWLYRLSRTAILTAPVIDHRTVFVADWNGVVTALRDG
jgi:outer membrane protein assembly factor BamB